MEVFHDCVFTPGNNQEINSFCATRLVRLCDISLHRRPPRPRPVVAGSQRSPLSLHLFQIDISLNFVHCKSCRPLSSWELFNLEYHSDLHPPSFKYLSTFCDGRLCNAVYRVFSSLGVPPGSNSPFTWPISLFCLEQTFSETFISCLAWSWMQSGLVALFVMYLFHSQMALTGWNANSIHHETSTSIF